MTTRLLFSLLLIGYVAAVTIEPMNPVSRNGETIQLMCRVRGVIKNCLWQINDNLYTLQDGGKYQPAGNLMDGECGITTTITEAENGQWTCRVFVEGVVDKAQSATTNVTVYSRPSITLSPSGDMFSVEAGEAVTVNCTVADARPMPAITWMLDDRELSQTSNPVAVPRSEGKFTITSSLQYAFQAGDHAKRLRCVTSGTWLTPEDDREAFTRLDVMFPPLPKDPMTLYGFGIGQSGDLVVNFTSNPKPSFVAWRLNDDSTIQVEPYSPSTASTRYEVGPLRAVENAVSVYEAHLKIKSVEELDAKKTFTLVVQSELSNDPQEYVVRISTSPTPVPSNSAIQICPENGGADCGSDRLAGSVSGGGIAAIIIVLIAIVVVVGVVLYARNTGRWCFAGNKAVGVSTKENDEEAGQAGVEHHNDDDEVDGEKTEPTQRQSLTHRLSSLYETLMSKAAPKKSASATSASAAAPSATTPPAPETESPAKDGVVYAELDLKTPEENADGVSAASAVRMVKEEATEYAEIVPVKPAASPAKMAE